MRRSLLLVAGMLAGAIGLGLAGCGSGAVDEAADPVVVDVRTDEEWAEGHLDGAVHLPLADPGFEAAVEELDGDTTYQVYCRTGNRSAQAADIMRDAGFKVEDLGGIDEAAEATGLPIVT